jgi:glucose/mannose transport system substrate-binding protein
LEPLDDLYKANGWYDVFPATLIPLISKDGHPYSVPVNIHRANVMWYNPKVLAQYGVAAPDPANFQSWIDSMDALVAAGMAHPLALGEQWTVVQLYETVLLATVGPQTYTDLWNGKADWNSDGVKKSIENFAKLLTYANTDYATLTWQDASKLVADGDAAFNVMGDWADGYFEGSVDGGNLGLKEKTDFDWMPVPGTKGSYDFLSDSFVLPVGAKHRDAAIKWLTLCGSKEGQDAFNPVKGSISARNDSDASLYNPYLQSAMADWKTDVVVGSLWHGVVANDTWKAAINDAFGKFLTDGDIAALQAALVDSCATSGSCKK